MRLNIIRKVKNAKNKKGFRKVWNSEHGFCELLKPILLNLLCSILMFFFIGVGDLNAQATNGSVTNQSADTKGTKSDSNLRSVARVNPSTLAMEFSLPITNYPGRAGNSTPLSISYSSKVWQMDALFTWWWTTPLGQQPRFVTDIAPRFAKKSVAGWTSSLIPPRIDEEIQAYTQFGKHYDYFLDEVSVGNNYHQQEQNLLNGNNLSNLISSPNLCGWVCTGGQTQVCFNGECTDWECHGWSDIYCAGISVGRNPYPSNENTHPPKRTHYVKRVRIQMPSGSMVEFRKDDKVHGYCIEYGINNPANCEMNGPDKLGDFLAVDGSGMRLNRTASESILHMPNGSKYKFPSLPLISGQQWYATEFTDVNGNKKTFSREYNLDGEVTKNKWTDTLGQEIVDPLPHNWIRQLQRVGTKEVPVPGLNGTTRIYKLKWLQLIDKNGGESAMEDPNQKLAYEVPKICRGGRNHYDALPPSGSSNRVLFPALTTGLRTCNPTVEQNNRVVGALFNPIVLAEVELPNGQKYQFKYNDYGEVSKIIYPSGSYETFVYNKVMPLSSQNNVVYDQTNRGVTERRVYQADGTLAQRWQYSVDIAGNLYPRPITGITYTVTTIAPHPDNPMLQGAKTEQDLIPSSDPSPGSPNGNFGFSDPRTGMPKETRSYDELGLLRSRTLTEYITTPPRTASTDPNAINEPRAERDPRASRSVSFTFEPTDTTNALATYSKTTYDDNGSADPEFFSHLNAKKSEGYEYAAISKSLAETTTNWTTIESWFPASKLASATETDYIYDTPYKENGVIGLVDETRVLNPNNQSEVLAKTQPKYDEYLLSDPGATTGYVTPDGNYPDKRGNVTTQKLWDDDNNIWIESHTEYDKYGNAVKKIDNEGRVATVEFDSVNKFAYPIRTISPAPGDGITGTNQQFKTETIYDFTTGLVKETRDLRDLTNSTDDLVTTTEYNDSLLRPTAVVSGPKSVSYANRLRAETIYNDDPNHVDGLWVKTRSQFDTNTWNEAFAYSDSLGRTYKSRTIDSNGDVVVESKFDFAGRVIEASNPYRIGTNASEILWSKTEYDEAGRVENVYSPMPAGQTGDPIGTSEYGIVNNINGITGVWSVSIDASGRKSRSITNSLGQLARVDEATGFGGSIDADLGTLASPHQATSYAYNIKGEMVQVTQGTQKRNFLYDSLGRLIRVKQPEQEVNGNLPNKTDPITTNSQWTAGFKYDVNGKLIRSTDAKGVNIINEYDNADRVLKRCYSKPNVNTQATTCAALGSNIDPDTPTVTYKYDLILNGKGALIETSNGISTSKTTKIDDWGRPTEYQQLTKIDSQTNLNCGTQTGCISKYKYNLSGALIEETYPSGRVVKNTFDSNGDVARVFGKATPSSVEKTYANSFNYNASGGISAMRLGNGKWETAKFNKRLQVTELGLGHASQDASLWKVNYEFGEYDSNNGLVDTTKNTGNIAKQTVSFNGLPNAFVQTYQYDSLYRLKEANEKAGATENWKQDFTYDRYGNRLTHNKFINGSQITHNQQTHPSIDASTNRFSDTNQYGYDKAGNLIADNGRTFTFDGNNKQILVTGNNGTVGEYFYDGDGMRVKKHVYTGGNHTKTIIFVYSGGKLVEEYSTDPVTSPKIKYLTEDHLGTPRIITDGTGEVVSRRDFMPFGQEIAKTTGTRSDSSFKYSSDEDDVKQKFTGYQQDGETMLDFAEARMYENRHARFTAVDPLLASGNSASPQTFNRFIYCGNNPIACTDPTGLIGWVFHDGGWKYDSRVNDQASADEHYGKGTTFRADGEIVTQGGRAWQLLGQGRWTLDGVEVPEKYRYADQATITNSSDSSTNSSLNENTQELIQYMGKRGPALLNLMKIFQAGSGGLIGCIYFCPPATVGAIGTGTGVTGVILTTPTTACGTGSGSTSGGGGRGSDPCGGQNTSGGAPALEYDPYNKDIVDLRIKPPYKINDAHDPNHPSFNPFKSPEPNDAKAVYNGRVLRTDHGTWWGRSSNGDYYRYFGSNSNRGVVQNAHFSGSFKAKQVPNKVIKFFGGNRRK